MRLAFFLFPVFLSLIISCSQDIPPPQNEMVSIKYKINGVQVTYTDSVPGYNANATKLTTMWPETRYLFEGHSGSSELFQAMIITDSLKPLQYRYDSTNFSLINIDHNAGALQSSLYFNGDYFNITITSYANGKISGLFTGRLSPYTIFYDYNQRGSVMITEGAFTNLKITYQ
ncbi:MAG: hypothetical protein IPH18_07045 [Chitinophagaceae bacterium]|nr:hypothetical protein [Chitinophagaceae bacterium]